MSSHFSALTPDEGEEFILQPFTIRTRVSGAQTGGNFELYQLDLGNSTVDYHVHNAMDETLCVVEGDIEFTVAGRKYQRAAGSVTFIPRGLHHGFTNHGPARAKVLALFTPATGQDQYFRELVKLFSAPTLNADALHALQKQFDQQLIAPNE
jgi:quercetin dioxygenase-like cupin family protein